MLNPEIAHDRDGATIGSVYHIEIGELWALPDGGFMLALDAMAERSDLEQLHALIGKVLERATGAGSLVPGA
jgi:hypothetical protein